MTVKFDYTVKNGFPTGLDSKKSQSRIENNRQGDHQSKALIKGCHKRTKAWGHVPSQEKVHTGRNLARAMAKSRARHRQSWQMCQMGREKVQGFY